VRAKEKKKQKEKGRQKGVVAIHETGKGRGEKEAA